MQNLPKIPQLIDLEILPWFNKLAMAEDCVKQVQKDLVSYGIQLTYSGNVHSAYIELFNQLEPQLNQLLKNGSHTIQEILYRVDVNQSAVNKAKLSDEPLSEALSRLILWRELQKVVTRFLIKQK